MAKPKADSDQLSEKEAAKRMEDAIRRAQKMPHKPHAAKKKKGAKA